MGIALETYRGLHSTQGCPLCWVGLVLCEVTCHPIELVIAILIQGREFGDRLIMSANTTCQMSGVTSMSEYLIVEHNKTITHITVSGT